MKPGTSNRKRKQRAEIIRSVLCALVLLSGSAILTYAFAIGYVGFPSPELIKNADHYQPPKLGTYAAKLAQQPDMEGLWNEMRPKDSGEAPVFDPAHNFYPKQLFKGETTFGEVPGTYIKGVPYNAKYQKIYRERIAEALAGKSVDTFAACVPYGVPRMMGDGGNFDIVQAPEMMIWYSGGERTERRIFLDGRKQSNPRGGPTYSGNSVGHWEGTTLVVDTVGLMAGIFDMSGAPHSDKLHIVERIRLIAANILEDQMTLTDPVTMVGPWVVTSYFHRNEGKVVHQSLNDRPCTTNVVTNKEGFQVLVLPQEVEAAGGNVAAAAAADKQLNEGGTAGAGGVTDPGVAAGSPNAAEGGAEGVKEALGSIITPGSSKGSSKGSSDSAPAGSSQTDSANPGRTR